MDQELEYERKIFIRDTLKSRKITKDELDILFTENKSLLTKNGCFLIQVEYSRFLKTSFLI